jgi:hypothetical protein
VRVRTCLPREGLPVQCTQTGDRQAQTGDLWYENPPYPPLPHAGGRARVGAESGQSATIFIRRGVPGRVMTTVMLMCGLESQTSVLPGIRARWVPVSPSFRCSQQECCIFMIFQVNWMVEKQSAGRGGKPTRRFCR